MLGRFRLPHLADLAFFLFFGIARLLSLVLNHQKLFVDQPELSGQIELLK